MVAHEPFHYLRKTRQVAGRPGEIEADAFALMMLERYRDESKCARSTSLKYLAKRIGLVEVREHLQR